MIAGLIAALLAGLVLFLTGAPLALGAHPFWAVKVIAIGVPLGAVMFVALFRLRKMSVLFGSGAMICVAYAVADIGKSRFGASYGDDAFAGQMWFFGWIAICAFVALFVAAAARRALDNNG